MMKNPIFSYKPERPFSKEFVRCNFDLKITKFSDKIDDESFIFEDEILMANFGEVDKFSSDYIYQSKVVIFKEKDSIYFGGYSPDFRRKADILKDKNDNHLFSPNDVFHIEIILSKYRVYISINDGILVDTYGNARILIDEFAFYARKGFDAEISNFSMVEYDEPYQIKDKTLSNFINNGLFCNYLNYHVDDYGVYFDRLNIEQNICATTRNSGQYESSVSLDFYTDSKKVGIEYEVMDSEVQNYPLSLGFLVNGQHQEVESKIANKKDVFFDEFLIKSDKKINRVTIILPTCFCIAIKRVVIDENSIYEKVNKDKTILFLGDSITEGSECLDSGYFYPTQIATYFNATIYNFAISGRTFNHYNLLGKYDIKPDYIIIANGTNSFCMGTAEKDPVFEQMEKDMILVIDKCYSYFPNAKIIGLLPIWRNDENGPKYTLLETSAKIREVYERYSDITVIDCYQFIPFDASYFSNPELALHPVSKGHKVYGEKLIECLKEIIK